MKKFIIFVVLGIMFLLAGCGRGEASVDQEKIDSIVANAEVLQEEVDALQKELDTNQQELDNVIKERDKYKADYIKIQDQLDEMLKEKVVQDSDVTITVVDKIDVPADTDKWIFSSRSNFHISITNNTGKEIKGIQGSLDIQDMFGVSIMESQCDLTGYTILPDETYINTDLGLEINEYMADHVKVFTTAYDDLIFIYNVDKIMFTDGTLKEKE